MYCYIVVQYTNIVSFFSYKLQISSVLARTRGTMYTTYGMTVHVHTNIIYYCAKLSVINPHRMGGGLGLVHNTT